MSDDMKRRLEYFSFALETYKSAFRLTGREAYSIFKKTKADEYIFDLYELLHVHGAEYLLTELQEYMQTQPI